VSRRADDASSMHLFVAVTQQGTLSDAAERSGINAVRLGAFLWNCAQPEPHEVDLLWERLGVAWCERGQVSRSAEAVSVDREAAWAEAGRLYDRAVARIDQLGGRAADLDEASGLARLIAIVDAVRPTRSTLARG
jgi:hypothetical protein